MTGVHPAEKVNSLGLQSTLAEVAGRLTKPSSLLFAGIFLRIIIFVFLSPQNVDPHADVIKFIVDHGQLPFSNELGQAYHPPLYYILVAPIFWLSGSVKAVQIVSLLFSTATLIVIYRILFFTPLIGPQGKIYGFALACFLPQFVMFTLYVSNDTLAIFIGSLIAYSLHKFIERRNWRQLFGLAALLGLGLSTKATFLVFAPILCFLVCYLSFSMPRASIIDVILKFAAFLFIATMLGGYKYLDNYLHLGKPLFNNLDLGKAWVAAQKKTLLQGCAHTSTSTC